MFFWFWGFIQFLGVFPLILPFFDDGLQRSVLEFA
jgi:hypothetical protein